MTSLWTWERLESVIQVTGSKQTYTEEDCQSAAKEIGLPNLPPSYVELMRRFGIGEWQQDFFIYVPQHETYPVTLAIAIEDGREIAQTLLDGGVTIPEPGKFLRLLMCGRNGAGFSLFWDPASRDASGEMPLYMTDRESLRLVPVGRDLVEFFGDYWIDKKIDKVSPLWKGGSWESMPIFKAGI